MTKAAIMKLTLPLVLPLAIAWAEEEARKASERRFRDLFQNSPDAIFVEDLDGTVLDANTAACRLHGMTHAELVGKKLSVDPTTLEAVKGRVQVKGAPDKDFARAQMTWLLGVIAGSLFIEWIIRRLNRLA